MDEMKLTQRQRFILEALAGRELTVSEISKLILENRNKKYNDAVISMELTNLTRDDFVASMLREKVTRKRAMTQRYYWRTI